MADHLHHHGLMFAVAADGVSYWDEFPTAGKQIHQTIETTAAGLLQKLTWQGPSEQRPSLRETRRVEVSATLVGGTTLLTWRTRLQAAEDRAPVKLTGNHYFGLGMRFPESMDSASRFFTVLGPVDGEIVRGVFETIDDAGRLIVRANDNRRIVITAGDVHFGATASARS